VVENHLVDLNQNNSNNSNNNNDEEIVKVLNSMQDIVKKLDFKNYHHVF